MKYIYQSCFFEIYLAFYEQVIAKMMSLLVVFNHACFYYFRGHVTKVWKDQTKEITCMSHQISNVGSFDIRA